LPIWERLSLHRLNEELSLYPQLKKMWENLQNIKLSSSNPSQSKVISDREGSKSSKVKGKKRAKIEVNIESVPEPPKSPGKESSFIPCLIDIFLKEIDKSDDLTSQKTNEIDNNRSQLFIQVFLEFLCDLLSQLPTRRFLRTLLHDMNLVIKIKLCSRYQDNGSNLIKKMTDLLDMYMNFPFQDHSGKALSPDDVLNLHYKRMHTLQQIVYKDYFSIMKDMIFSSIGRLLNEDTLRKNLMNLSLTQISDVAVKLGRISIDYVESWKTDHPSATTENAENNLMDEYVNEELYTYIMQTLVDYLIPKLNQLEEINMLSLYPTEDMLWNESIMPPSNISNSNQVLALPKLNIQFLTLYDYLLRNFSLYRLETAYEIREDLMDTIKRMGPKETSVNVVSFKGWARMALPIVSISIDEIAQPKLSSPCPAFVNASIVV